MGVEESPGPVHTEVRGSHQNMITRRYGSLGAISVRVWSGPSALFLRNNDKTDGMLLPRFSSVQFSRVLATRRIAAHQASLSITNSQSLLKLMSIKSVMPYNHLIFCRPLLVLPSIFPSIRVFSKESGLRIRWPKFWNFSFSISPSNEYSGLISFRMDWVDLLAVQGTLTSLLQHHRVQKINSSALSFLYSPTLTAMHDYWKKHSFH